MIYRIDVTVANRKEGEAIARGLADARMRAFVAIMGFLLALPNDRARERVLAWVAGMGRRSDRRRTGQQAPPLKGA
jgi:hypothetical protein